MILNVAANNGNTTMTTQKQFEKFYEYRNNRKNEKIKKKQLTRRMKGAIIAKSLVRQSISTKKTKKSLKKVLDKYKMI